jgi:hypothetical protein
MNKPEEELRDSFEIKKQLPHEILYEQIKAELQGKETNVI